MSPTTELIQIYVNINFINFNKFLLCGCVVENGKWLHATGVVLPFQSVGAGSALMLGFLGGLWGWGAAHLTLLSFFVGMVGLWMLLGGWKIFYILMQTLPRWAWVYLDDLEVILFRDLKGIIKLVRLGLLVKRAERQNLTVPKVFQRSKHNFIIMIMLCCWWCEILECEKVLCQSLSKVNNLRKLI